MEFNFEYISIFIPAWFLILAGFTTAFIITFVSIPPIVTLARTKGFYDMPNGRTSHLQATPYLGGVAVFTGLILSTVLVSGIGFEHDLMYIIAGLVILLFIGLKDDMLMINPLSKLAGQLTASGIIIVLGNIRIDSFHGIFDIQSIPYFASIALTLFVFIVIINGINLIDGIDGLASGVGIIISFAIGAWFMIGGFIHYSVMCFALAGSLIAFFYFNVFSKKQKIFLGDAGSLMIGLTISVFVIRFLNYQAMSFDYNVHSAPAIAFGILIIPFFDTMRVFVLRLIQGRSPFSADRQHIHHVLIDLGNSHKQATTILLSFNILFIILSISLRKLENIPLISIQIILAMTLSYILVLLLRKKRDKIMSRNKVFRGKQITLHQNDSSEDIFDQHKKNPKYSSKFQFLNILNF